MTCSKTPKFSISFLMHTAAAAESPHKSVTYEHLVVAMDLFYCSSNPLCVLSLLSAAAELLTLAIKASRAEVLTALHLATLAQWNVFKQK